MKRNLILIICCLAVAISSTAQPQWQKAESRKQKAETLFSKSTLSSRKQKAAVSLVDAGRKTVFSKTTPKEDWWEPDVIYQYWEYEEAVIRRVFSYSNEKCSGELWQEMRMNQWNNTGRIVHTYDTHDNKIESLFQEWESNQWSNSIRYVYKYDAQKNMTEELWQYWNGVWKDDELRTYKYDSYNRMIEKIIYDAWGGDLEVEDKMVYKYDEHNNLIEERHQYLEDEDEWEDYMIIMFSYNEQNQLTGAILQELDDIWEDYVKLTVLYDLENYTISHIYSFIEEDELWYEGILVIYSYDSQNNLLSESWFEGDDGEWEEVFSFNYSYDENNNATQGYYVESYKKSFIWDWDEYPELTVYYNNMQSKISTYDDRKFTATYLKPSELGIIDNNLQNHSFTLYPNPTTGELRVTSYDSNKGINPLVVEVFDIYGRNLTPHTTYLAPHTSLDISHLQSGIYFVKIDGVIQKVVKQF